MDTHFFGQGFIQNSGGKVLNAEMDLDTKFVTISVMPSWGASCSENVVVGSGTWKCDRISTPLPTALGIDPEFFQAALIAAGDRIRRDLNRERRRVRAQKKLAAMR